MRFIIILLLLNSCSTQIPLKKEFNRIHNQKYILNVNDCSNKSALYYELLEKAGYAPKIVIFSVSWHEQNHVMVSLNGKFYCVTSGKVYDSEWRVNRIYGGKLMGGEWDLGILRMFNEKDYEIYKEL